MDGISADKILKAGFTIIRKDDQPSPRIKRRKAAQIWETLEKFDTKAARDKRFRELLDQPDIIQD